MIRNSGDHDEAVVEHLKHGSVGAVRPQREDPDQ